MFQSLFTKGKPNTIQATMSTEVIQATITPAEEHLCYICCEPDSPENPLLTETPCLCKTMELHTNCYQQLRQTLGGTCKACKVDFPWRPLLAGAQRMHTYTESSRPDLKFMTIYEVDAEGRPHGRMETVRYEEGGIQTDRSWCAACECYHEDGPSREVKPGVRSLSSVGQFVHGLRHGLWHLYPCTGNMWECEKPWVTVPYENGVPHGIVLLEYHKEDGIMQEAFTMVHGVIQGQRTIVNRFTGYKLECTYLDGKLHGQLSIAKQVVIADGGGFNQTTTQEYHHGVPKGNRITNMRPVGGYHHNRKMLHSVVGIKDGQLNGPTLLYYPGPSKQLACIANFRNGVLKGRVRCWDERGELKESHFFTGEEHYKPTEEYLALKEWIDDHIHITHYEVPELKAHIMTSVDPGHQVGFAYPDASLLSKTARLAVMYNTFAAAQALKHFKGYFPTSTSDVYSEHYSDEDYYSDYYDDRYGDDRW